VDWWSLGVIVYEMLVGVPPFYNKTNKERLFKSIKIGHIKYPSFLSDRAVNFMKQLFVHDIEDRLGSKGPEEIKAHPFFKDVNWDLLIEKKIKPPFVPVLKNKADTKYIDSEFLDETPSDSFNTVDEIGSKDVLFTGFSYNNDKA
jgi:serine/threonine protein kinase